MLSEKPWNRELLLLLVAGLLVSWCIGTFLGILLEQLLPLQAFSQKVFYRFVVNTVTLDGVTVLLVHQFLKLHGISWADFLGLTKAHWPRAILFALVAGVLILPVVLAFNGWMAWLINLLSQHPAREEPAIKILKAIVGVGHQICFGVAAIIVVPVAEESLFRGILYPYIKQTGHPRLALWGTSLLFGLIHMNLVTLLPLTLFAVVMVFVYEKTDTLLAPITTHALFNAVNFCLAVFQTDLTGWLQRFKWW